MGETHRMRVAAWDGGPHPPYACCACRLNLTSFKCHMDKTDPQQVCGEQRGTQVSWLDRAHLPAYRVPEAAVYARLSSQTVSAWQRNVYTGAIQNTGYGRRKGLSYLQLIEIAVVATLRHRGVKLKDIREARAFIARFSDGDFPFARQAFLTDGVDILLDYVPINRIMGQSNNRSYLSTSDTQMSSRVLLTRNESGREVRRPISDIIVAN